MASKTTSKPAAKPAAAPAPKPAAKPVAQAPAPKTGNYRSPDGSIKSYATGQVVTPAPSSNASSPAPSTNVTDSSGKPTYDAPPTIQFPDTPGHPELTAIATAINANIHQLWSQGVRLNPNVKITPDVVQQFLDKAVSESHPYYQGLYASNKAEIQKSLASLATDAQTSLDTTTRNFNVDLRNEQNQAGESGMALSGERTRNERNLAAGAQASLDTTQANYNTNAQSQYGAALRQLGSANLTDTAPKQLSTPNIASSFVPGQTPGNTQQATRSLSPTFNLSSDVTGSIEDAQKQAQNARTAELSTKYLSDQSRSLYGAT